MGASSGGRLGVLLFAAVAFAAGSGPLPDGEGKKIVEAACVSCHGLEVVGGKQWSRQRWQTVVAAMVDRGASLNKDEAPVVVEYLAKNFGDRDRGKTLVGDICSQCHEWQRVKGRELTKEQWAGLIKGMIFEGSPVTDEEFNLIVEYLAKNFGPAKD